LAPTRSIRYISPLSCTYSRRDTGRGGSLKGRKRRDGLQHVVVALAEDIDTAAGDLFWRNVAFPTVGGWKKKGGGGSGRRGVVRLCMQWITFGYGAVREKLWSGPGPTFLFPAGSASAAMSNPHSTAHQKAMPSRESLAAKHAENSKFNLHKCARNVKQAKITTLILIY
jgi:hypothetical protein